jgi:ribonuclease HI
VNVAKALAAVYTVEFCKAIGFSDIILESDAFQVINAVNSRGHNWSKMVIQ